MKKRYIFRLTFIALSVLFGTQIAAAQTCDVTWRKADNPRIISDTLTIPANQTVCIEPGAVVQFTANGAIDLLGRIIGAGTAAERITFTGQNVFPNRIIVAGTLDLSFADIGVKIGMSRGTFVCRDCRFNLRGGVSGGTFSFISLENTVFDSSDPVQGFNASLSGSGFTAVLRNVTFRNNAYFDLGNSYLFVDNIVSQTSAYDGLTFGQGRLQPFYLNNLNITNSARAGLKFIHGNYFIGENVVIQNAEYPIAGPGGLLPGSQVPASGNRNNLIDVGQASGDLIFAPVGAPYVMNAFNGGVTFLPGAVIKARENFAFNSGGGTLRLLGLPDAPITIEPLNAGQKWISGQFNTPGDRLEYVALDGSQLGIANPGGAGSTYYIDNSILRNHDTAITSPDFQFAFLQGNLFTGNGVAINDAEGSARASGRTNPNLFENNQTAVNAFANNSDLRYNWWNSPTGPTSPLNSGGTGEIINGSRPRFNPFLTARPDTTDRPPVVRMPQVPYRFALGPGQGLLDARTRQLINWRASDDRQIVKQKILFSPSGNGRDDFTIVADNLPATQNSFELNVPNVGFQPSGTPAFVRVVAIDDKGQEGWDEWQVVVPSGEITGELNITSNVAGQTFRGGDFVPLTWTSSFPSGYSYQVFLLLDGDRKAVSAASGSATGTFSDAVIPYVSTDSARFAVVVSLSLNRQKWFFSQPFSIRPEARYPDAPPTVTLTSPTANQQIPAGSPILIQWTAADDEAVRRFDIQASTDGGRTWVNIAENLPPTATSFNWQPNFTGSFDDVRVRVVAVDRRFQNSSDGATRVFRITFPANAAPTVQVTFPSNNAAFASGKSIFVAANATDSDGTIQRVEFYATVDYIGQEGSPSTTLIGSDATAPYQIGWNYPSADNYTITARVIDNRGATAVSAPINVNVNTGNPAPLPINVPELTEPRDDATFPANSNITLEAAPGNGNRPIVRVEFYNGIQLLGSDATAPYELVWNNVPAGRYTIFARTVANNGAEATSKPADISVGASNTQRTRFDFDGDGKADVSVFRPSNGAWYISQSTNGFTGVTFGFGTDKLAPADYDGDGKTDVAVFRDGFWYYLKSSDGAFVGLQFGQTGDIPRPADFDGDGRADINVFRPSNGAWYRLNSSNGAFVANVFGQNGDQPLIADFDGDGKNDLAVFRSSGGIFYWVESATGQFKAAQFGLSTDIPTPGDFDGDGKTDVAVFRPTNGAWYRLNSSNGAFVGTIFGQNGDIPTPADYDGDGKADIGVFRDGNWYHLNSSNGAFVGQLFGFGTDKPTEAAFQ